MVRTLPPPPPPHPPKKSHVLWVSIEISIPHPPKKSHVLWVSMEISIPAPPENKQKYSYPASSQTQRGPVQLFSGISNVHRGNTYETFSLHLQNSFRDGEVGNYLFLTDVRIQRGIGGPDPPPPPHQKK